MTQHRSDTEGIDHLTEVPPLPDLPGVDLWDCWCMAPCCWDGKDCVCPECYCNNPAVIPPVKA